MRYGGGSGPDGSRATDRLVRDYGPPAEGDEARFEPGRRHRAEPLARPIRSSWEHTIVSPVILAAAVLAVVIIWLALAVVNGPQPPLSHHH